MIERPSHQTFDNNKKLSILIVSKIQNYKQSGVYVVGRNFPCTENPALMPQECIHLFICIAISLELQSKDLKSGWVFLITVSVVAIRPTTRLNSSARHAAHQFSYVYTLGG